jgi:hypothetical protein
VSSHSLHEPYRGTFGEPRPRRLDGLALPPAPMPARDGLRPLKAWRYVGLYGPELMVCAADIRVGPARQSFWAVWDRDQRRLYERTRLRRGVVQLHLGHVRVVDREVQFELWLEETDGVETVSAHGDSYAWTRKQGGIAARGRIVLGGEPRMLEGRAVIDDTAGYYERHTRWCWSAGVGTTTDRRAVAWNLVTGVHDAAHDSERTVWIDGVPHEADPAVFAADLSQVGGLRFRSEAVRARTENLVLVRSDYRQPFGTFSGALPGGVELAEGYGVMEAHDARW